MAKNDVLMQVFTVQQFNFVVCLKFSKYNNREKKSTNSLFLAVYSQQVLLSFLEFESPYYFFTYSTFITKINDHCHSGKQRHKVQDYKNDNMVYELSLIFLIG